MTTGFLAIVMTTSLVLFGQAAGAKASDNANLLTTIEVRQLVMHAEPADHSRLRDHFAALANWYADQARRDVNRGRALRNSANRRLGPGAGYKFLARADAENNAAEVVRKLAAHHDRLAAGVASEAPKDGARFEAGEGAAPPTDAVLRRLAEGARTSADHGVLQEYYVTVAAKNAKLADDHLAMARLYRASGIRSGNPELHCDRLVKVYREAARAARATADEHSQHAG